MAHTPNNHTPDDGAMPASEIKLEAIEFVCDGMFPLKNLTIVAGVAGKGKSTYIADVLAAATREGHNVVQSGTEDVASMIRARFELAGGDLAKMFVLGAKDEDHPIFPDDIGKLERVMAARKPKVVVLDPAADHLKPNIMNDQGVRQALTPLVRLAQRHNCAIVIVAHTLKNLKKGADPASAIPGNGLRNKCRMAYLFGINPADENERVLANVKNQYGPLKLARVYAIESDLVEDEVDGVTVEATRLILTDDAAKIDPLSILTPPKEETAKNDAPKLSMACEWLYGMLSDGSKVPHKDLLADARADGISKATLNRAKKEANVEDGREGFGKGSFVYWYLPDGHPARDDYVPPAPAARDADAELTQDDIDKLLGGQ